MHVPEPVNETSPERIVQAPVVDELSIEIETGSFDVEVAIGKYVVVLLMMLVGGVLLNVMLCVPRDTEMLCWI